MPRNKFGQTPAYNATNAWAGLRRRPLIQHEHGDYLKLDGSTKMEGELNLGKNHIKNIRNIYIKGSLQCRGSAIFDGGVSVKTDPSKENDLTTKKYVDRAVTECVNEATTYSDDLLVKIKRPFTTFNLRVDPAYSPTRTLYTQRFVYVEQIPED